MSTTVEYRRLIEESLGPASDKRDSALKSNDYLIPVLPRFDSVGSLMGIPLAS